MELRLLQSPIYCHVSVSRFIKGPANETSHLHHCHSMMLSLAALEVISHSLGAYLHVLAPVLGLFVANTSGLWPLFPLNLCGFELDAIQLFHSFLTLSSGESYFLPALQIFAVV